MSDFTEYDLTGLPSDLLTNRREGDRRLKVDTKYSQTESKILETLEGVLKELQFQNLMFKEAFRIDATIEDLNDED